MEPNWHSPDSWQKDGSSISGVTSLKKGAWTSILNATETHEGRSTPVVIKTFSVPEDVVQDPQRVTAEREKFLVSARLQRELTEAGAKAWVRILKLSDDPQNPSFVMEKCGPSLEDLLEHKAHLSEKDLYGLVHSVLQALSELKDRHKRSHGNIKLSDVLSSPPNALPPFKLADPASKGEEHSANDLYALGLILVQLVEHREYDPMTQLLPTQSWARFGGKRDRWIQFCNLLLSPNGCHLPLADVRKEALRLRSSPLKYLFLTATAAALIVAGAVGYHFVVRPLLTPSGNGGGSSPVAQVDPQIKADYDQTHQAYQDLRSKWSALQPTTRYDHTKSRSLSRDSRALIPDQVVLSDPKSYREAAVAYRKASTLLQQAIDEVAAEEKAGQQSDSTAQATFLQAQNEYLRAKTGWDAAAAQFTPGRDHTRSQALAQAAVVATRPAPADPVAALSGAEVYRASAAKFAEALALVSDEDKSGLTQDSARTTFEEARQAFQRAKDQWTAAEKTSDVDLTAARAAAQRAQGLIPDQIVITGVDSYRTTAELYQKAAQLYLDAVTLVEQGKRSGSQRQTDIAAAVTIANQALKDKKYPEALAAYRKAADLGSPSAMHNVGLMYETGQGTTRDYAQAAQWYRKAADLQDAPAMHDLGLLYERGTGIEQNYALAAQWYRKAADLKIPGAMVSLAYLCEHGLGVPQDYAESLKYYRQAADMNDATAMNNVGVFYDRGQGVKIDYAQAMTWYKKAADLGNPAAMNGIGALYDSGHGVKTDYAQAMTWYKKAADLNNASAMCNIGVLYDNGLGVALDHKEAMKWFVKAADLKHGLAMYNIAFLYETGRGVQPDVVQSVLWYRKAYASNDEPAKKLAAEALDRLGYANQ